MCVSRSLCRCSLPSLSAQREQKPGEGEEGIAVGGIREERPERCGRGEKEERVSSPCTSRPLARSRASLPSYTPLLHLFLSFGGLLFGRTLQSASLRGPCRNAADKNGHQSARADAFSQFIFAAERGPEIRSIETHVEFRQSTATFAKLARIYRVKKKTRSKAHNRELHYY